MEKETREEEASGPSRREGARKERPFRLRSQSPESRGEVSSGKVQELMIWLKENAGDNLTAAQMAQYILLQAVTLHGSFRRLLENALKLTWEQGVRNRNLMPLPLWSDVVTATEEVIMAQKYKDQPEDRRRWRGGTKTKARRALRLQGLLLWHGLVVVGLYWMHCGGSLQEGVCPPAGYASSQQESALCRIWELVKVLVDDKPQKGGVPRTQREDGAQELSKLRVSYTD